VNSETKGAMRWHAGGCHCGAVRFEVETPDVIEVEDCNCTMCAKTGFLHIIAPASRFRLMSGGDAISTYTFNTGVAKHLFCPKCGIKAFYVPRSNPDGYSVNLRCLDDPDDFTEVKIVPFNGRSDWEGQAHTLAHKSKD
jgi:hypothetical protein